MRSIAITFRIGAENMAKLSGLSFAILFGETSPKIRTMTVVAAVDTLAPKSSPKRRTNKSVAREAQAIFTILLPMRMVDRSLS